MNPLNLKIDDKNKCLTCFNICDIEINEIITDFKMCEDCYSYDKETDRPYQAFKQIDYICKCVKYNKQQIKKITCYKCLYMANNNSNNKINNKIYNKCDDKNDKNDKNKHDEFNKKWQNLNIKEKLSLYGILKLELLSKYKKIDVNGLTKEQIINKLEPFINKYDLPIKIR